MRKKEYSQKDIEKIIKESEDQFRVLFDSTFEGIFIHDKGFILDINQTAASLFKYKREELIGETVFKIISEESREDVQKKMAAVEKDPDMEFGPFETTGVSKDGLKYYGEVYSKRINYKNKDVRLVSFRDITDRKNAESALLESEKIFRILFDSTFEGIFIYEKGIILEANRTAESMLNYEPGEMEGLGVLNIIAEKSREDILQKLAEVANNPFLILGPYETTAMRKDGTTFFVEVHSKGLNFKGKVVRLVSFRDITERKIAQEELIRSEKQFRSIYDATFEGLVIYEKDKIVDANKTAALMFRYDRDELSGLNIIDIIADESRDTIKQKIAAAAKNPHIVFGPYEVTALSKNGMKYPVEVYSKGFNYKGRVTRLVSFRDITERKKAEEALRESEEKYRALFETSADGIVIADIETKIFKYANSALCSMLGYNKDELQGMRVGDIHPKESLEHVISEFEAQARSEKILAEDIPCLRKDGSIIYTDINTTRALIDGRACNVGFFRDITERKEAEEKLKEEKHFSETVIDTVPGLFYVFNERGRFIKWNKNTEKVSEYSPEEISKMHVSDLFDTKDKSRVASRIKDVFTKGYAAVEAELVTKSGKKIPYFFTGSLTKIGGKKYLIGEGLDITVRRKAEEKLKEANDIINSSPVVAFLWRNEEGWPVEFVSDNVEGLFGYTADEFISGKIHYSKTIHPDDLDRVTDEVVKYSKMKRRKKFTHKPYRIVTKDRKVKWIDDRTNICCRDKKGCISHYQGIVIDITERVEAEEKLRESEDLLRTIIDATKEAMITIGQDGLINIFNPAAEKIFTRKKEEMIGKTVDCLMPEEYSGKHQEYVKSYFRTGKPNNAIGKMLEVPGVRGDGSIFPMEISLSEGKYGSKQFVIAVARDITERKKAEKKIRESEERLELALIGGDLGLWDWNVKTGECYFDHRWTEMLGYKSDEIEPLNSSWEKILHPDDKAEVLKKLSAHHKDGTVLYEVEMRLLTKSGKWKWILGKGKVVERDESGMPIRMTGTHLDIDDRKKMEELRLEGEQRLRKMNDVLVSIAKHKKVISGDIDAAFEEITEAAVYTLEVVHSSIWIMSEDGRSSQCFDSFMQSTGEHVKGMEIKRDDKETSKFQEFFEKSRTIAVNDIQSDPFFKALYEQYFPEAGTTSTIKTPIRHHGKTIGVLSIDHEGTPRNWTIEEQNFAGSLTDIISIAMESSERIDAEKVLENKIVFQNLVAQISDEFINLPPSEFDTGINNVLQKIGEFTDADRCYVFVFKQGNTKMDNTHEWSGEGIEPQIEDLKDIDTKSLPWWMERLNRFENIHIPSVEELPEEAKAEKAILQAQDIKSLIVVPLKYYNLLYGFIGFDSIRGVKYWFADSIRLLETVGTTITKALEHKRINEELRQINEELEKKVEERTNELREKQFQLAQSEKMASLGNLVAGVAHEINTPLGALKSNNDIFVRSIEKIKDLLTDNIIHADAPESIALAKYFTNIEKLSDVSETAAERIIKIVKSLRSFARLDQADMDTVDIQEGIETTLTLVHHEIKGRIEVHKDFGEVPKITCYPNQLNQVFMNVLVNASHAIEEKGDIYIKTYNKDNNAVVEFRDTGKGIEKQNLKQIFDPGFTTKSRGVGTGLGLSIVYQIIKDHKGDIEVESEIGKGTTFRIILPT
ncbi:PAS domain S-box protein [candidate division KSB1 bacterium]